MLVRIYTDEGIVGVSEAPARPEIYGETQGSIVSIVNEYLGPWITGATLNVSGGALMD